MKKQRGTTSQVRHKQHKEGRLAVITVRYVSIPDAGPRLSRAIDILLESAASNVAPIEGSSNAKNEGPAQASRKDTATGGGEEDISVEA